MQAISALGGPLIEGTGPLAISKELEAQILRYHFVEHWGPSTIGTQLGVHHSTVDRVLSQAGLPKAERDPRPSIVDPYVPFITETLAQHPKLTAARLYAMAQARGYSGGPSQFRARVAQLRPRKAAEAYLRLRTLPGEQGQVDWGHFGTVRIGRAERALMAFVMVLSWSRRIYLRFYLNARMHSFVCGHVSAFEAWGALPRVLLYDNLKSAVLERRGQAIRFHPTLLELAAHYRFEPRPVAVARGNEKGRVERAIRYIREAFFAGRSFTDVDDLNAQAHAWCIGPAAQRRCPEDASMSVAQAFERELPRLLTLPELAFHCDERVEASVGKTPYVRFDLNDYSVPHTHVRCTVTVLASLTRVQILDGATLLAEHPRVFDKGKQVENPAHIQALVATKRAAREHRALDRLGAAVPASVTFIEQAVSSDATLKSIVRQLELLLDDYGAGELEHALTEAMQHRTCHPNAVRQVLQRRREQRELPPPLTLTLPDNDKARNIRVRTPSLADYDQLNQSPECDSEDDDPTPPLGACS
jgi:transposase